MSTLRPPPHLEGVLLHLESTSFLGRKWDKKYVKVLRSKLFLSRDESEYEKGNILESIELLQVDVYEVFIPNSSKSHVFKISGGEKFELCFSCDTANECTRWIRNLTTIKDYWIAYSDVFNSQEGLKRVANVKEIKCKLNDGYGRINKNNCNIDTKKRNSLNARMDPAKEQLNGHTIPSLPKDSFSFTLVMEDHSEITMTLSKSATYHGVIDVLLQDKKCPDCKTCKQRRTNSRLYLVNSSGQINEVDKDTILYPFYKARASFYLAEESTSRLVVIHFSDESFLPCLVKQDITTLDLLDHPIYQSRLQEIGPTRNLNLLHKIGGKITLCAPADTPASLLYDKYDKPVTNGCLLFQSVNERVKNMLDEQNEDMKQKEIMERAIQERLKREEEDSLKSKVKHALREKKAATRNDVLGAVPDIMDAYDAIKTERGQMRLRPVTLSSGQVIMEPYQSEDEDEDEEEASNGTSVNEDEEIGTTVIKEEEPYVLVNEARSVVNNEASDSFQNGFQTRGGRSLQISALNRNPRTQDSFEVESNAETVNVEFKTDEGEQNNNDKSDMSLNSTGSFIDAEDYSDMENYHEEHFEIGKEYKNEDKITAKCQLNGVPHGGGQSENASKTECTEDEEPSESVFHDAVLTNNVNQNNEIESDEEKSMSYCEMSFLVEDVCHANEEDNIVNTENQSNIPDESEIEVLVYEQSVPGNEMANTNDLNNQNLVQEEMNPSVNGETLIHEEVVETIEDVSSSSTYSLVDEVEEAGSFEVTKVTLDASSVELPSTENPSLAKNEISCKGLTGGNASELKETVAERIEDMLSDSTFSLIDDVEEKSSLEDAIQDTNEKSDTRFTNNLNESSSTENTSHTKNESEISYKDASGGNTSELNETVAETIEDMLSNSALSLVGETEEEGALEDAIQNTNAKAKLDTGLTNNSNEPSITEKPSYSKNESEISCREVSTENAGELNKKGHVHVETKVKIIRSSKFSPSSPARLVCDLCTRMGDDKPLLIKTKELMKWVMGQSTRNSSVTYICLLGTHFRCTDEGWDLADNCRISQNNDTLPVSQDDASHDKTSKFNIGNGYICTWIPKNNNNPPRWIIKQIGEVRRVSSPMLDVDVFTAHPTIPTYEFDDDEDGDDSMSFEDSFELPTRPPTSTSQMFDSVINTIKETTNSINAKQLRGNAEEKTKTFIKSALDRFDSISQKHFNVQSTQNDTIPFNNGVLPANLQDFQSLYTKPLQIVVLNIVNKFDGLTSEKQRQKGDDAKTPSTGWLVRNDLCTVMAKLLRIGLTDGRSILTSLFSRPPPLTLWKVVKDFTASFDLKDFVVVINGIDKNKWLNDDDMKFRFFICDLLNRSALDGQEKLLSLWLKHFASERTKINKYYLQSSFWRMDYKEHFELLFEEILLCLTQLNDIPFHLHDYFEIQLVQLSRSTPMIAEPQRRRANDDIVCVLE